MSLELIPLIVIVMALAAVVMLLVLRSRRGGRAVIGADPLCGRCEYCVRGLEGTICPECGSDLRTVGVLMPGSARPMTPRQRVILWTLAAPLPALLLYGVLSPLVVPRWIKTTQQRIIFSQAPYCFVIITAETQGKKLIFGQPDNKLIFGNPIVGTPGAVPEVLFLSHDKSHMDVRLPAKTFRFTSRAGNVVTGTFDAKAIETWLNDDGFADPRVAERAKDIAAAVDEVGTPAGKSFTKFAPDPSAIGASSGVAHPTATINVMQPNELTLLSGLFLGVLIWLAGLPLILRRPRPVRGVSVSPAQAVPA